MSNILPISPLSLNQLTRDYWGSYDAKAIQQLAKAGADPCYQMKFYKAPADNMEVLPGYAYVTHGLRITPGSIIFGFYLPAPLPLRCGPACTVQITDVSLGHKFWDDPVSAIFLANYKPECQSDAAIFVNVVATPLLQGSFPNLLCAPHPVVGSGLFDVEIQSTTAAQQRIQLILGVMEVCNVG
jgi:hypothetical protein